MISFSCPECGNGMNVPKEAAGKRGKCKNCGETIRVPLPKRKPSQEVIRVEPMEAPALRTDPPARPQSPVTVEVHQQKQSTNSLGITSLIIGVLAFLICWIPFVNFFSILLGAVGGLLAGIGIVLSVVRKGTGIGYSIGGGAVNGLALLIAVVMWGGILAVGNEAVRSVEEELERSNRVLTTPENPEPGNAADNETVAEDNETTSISSVDVPQDEWSNASNIYEDDHIKVSITSVRVGKVPLKSLGDDSKSEDDLLMVELELFNKSETKKMNFSGWKGGDFSNANAGTLQDEHENGYKRINFGFGADIVGQAKNESIYPQKSMTDLLVFELLIDSAKELRLELPASAYGGDGKIHLVYEVKNGISNSKGGND